MSKLDDLTGRCFGRLTVVRKSEETHASKTLWECKCDCGNTTIADSYSLKSGKRVSCGCLKAERKKDLTGKRFGKLVVVKISERRSNGYLLWECQCDCGNIKYTTTDRLLNGTVKSCGCARGRQAEDLTGKRFGLLVPIRPTEHRQANSIIWECQCDCGNQVLVPSVYLRSGKSTSCGCARSADLASINNSVTEGHRFGRLTTVRSTGIQEDGSVLWECKCDCGNTISCSSVNLVRGNTVSCGTCPSYSVTNVAGQKFGKLTAIAPTQQRKGGHIVWECLCDCGNTTFVAVHNLITGVTKSCGCLMEEYLSSKKGNG